MLTTFFWECQETLKHSLPPGSYLLNLVQWILKYHLLLHEVEKDTEGYNSVLDTIDMMQQHEMGP